MIEIGKTYIIKLDDGKGIHERPNCVVLDYNQENGLLKINQFGIEEIINTKSSSFAGIELDEPRKRIKIDCKFKKKEE